MQKRDARLPIMICECGWTPELSEHYRADRTWLPALSQVIVKANRGLALWSARGFQSLPDCPGEPIRILVHHWMPGILYHDPADSGLLETFSVLA